MMRSTLRSIRRNLVAWILLLTTTAGSATAQACATTCLIFYGRFTINDGEIYWYSRCTTTVIGGHTYIDCYYESGSSFY
jgi:hypothetical protein